MKIRITKPSGQSWYSAHVGEEFYVQRATVYFGTIRGLTGAIDYEVMIEPPVTMGTVSGKHCTVTDWTGWPFGEAHT